MENIIAQVSPSWPSDSNPTRSFEATDRQSPPLEVDDRMSERDAAIDRELFDLVQGILDEAVEDAGAGTSAIFASHDTDTTASTAGHVVLPNDSDTTYATNIQVDNVPHTNIAWAGYEGYLPAMPITSAATFGGENYEHRADTETAPCTESSAYESIWRTPRAEAMGVAAGDMYASGECAQLSIYFPNNSFGPRVRFPFAIP